MGGLLGMMMAVQPVNPIKKLLINDIEPFIPSAALDRIRNYVRINPALPSEEIFYDVFCKRMLPFGLKTEAEKRFLASISMRENADGTYELNYDPRIIAGLGEGKLADVDLWPLWEAVDKSVLILRGADSDILSSETMHRMMIGKRATSVTFADVGHAPALLGDDQIAVVRNWLNRP